MKDVSTTKTATIFGGTGFIGRQIVRELAQKGVIVKIATRVPERAYFLRPCGAVGQITAIACDYNDHDSIAAAIKGSDFVVNATGILYQKKRGQFNHVHRDIPEAIAKACQKENVSRFVHISALGVDKASSRYAYSKKEGEEAVLEACPEAIILRPSIVFGPDDDFFNKFARLSRILPALPLIGGGHTRFQPVYVGDIADAIMNALYGTHDIRGKIYELGGPETLTFKEILERVLFYTKRKRWLMPLPWFLASVQAFFMALLPNPLLTPDQVATLKTDNVVSDDALTLETLGVNPTAMGLILPSYLEAYKSGGRFSEEKQA